MITLLGSCIRKIVVVAVLVGAGFILMDFNLAETLAQTPAASKAASCKDQEACPAIQENGVCFDHHCVFGASKPPGAPSTTTSKCTSDTDCYQAQESSTLPPPICESQSQ